jgi:MFS family permease
MRWESFQECNTAELESVRRVAGMTVNEPRGAEQGSAVADRVPIAALLAANVVSSVGNSITTLAVPWFVLVTTGSAARMGITGAALGLGGVLTSVLGGPLVDRLGFKRGSVLADASSCVIVAAVPVLYLAGILRFWQLLVLVFLLSTLILHGSDLRLCPAGIHC